MPRRLSAIACVALSFCVSSAAAQSAPAPGGTLVVLVRHAEKAAEPAADPPLTEAGAARAEALALALNDVRFDAVIVTPTTRTRSTAGPTARRASLTPEEMAPRGGVAVHAAAVAERIRAVHSGRRVLVVGHSNTVMPIIRALGGPVLPDLCDAQHSMLFVLHIAADGNVSLVRSRYGAPDPTDAASCVPMSK